ncbi:MAG: hypothetical protein ACI4JN_06195 [Ruminococcus sp.]
MEGGLIYTLEAGDGRANASMGKYRYLGDSEKFLKLKMCVFAFQMPNRYMRG